MGNPREVIDAFLEEVVQCGKPDEPKVVASVKENLIKRIKGSEIQLMAGDFLYIPLREALYR